MTIRIRNVKTINRFSDAVRKFIDDMLKETQRDKRRKVFGNAEA
jgi:hypothetical protein